MRVVKISITEYNEQDFFLLTTLTNEQIVGVIMPIIFSERIKEKGYNNSLLVEELSNTYPLEFVKMYKEFETITI